MRSHAKASSAGSSSAQAKVSVIVLSGALLAALVLLTSSAFAAKSVFTWVGSSSTGTLGGQFAGPKGVAVNSTGAGGVTAGSIYVADQTNDRIQQFSPDGDFVRAWGFDVIQPGKPGDLGSEVFEVCEVAADCQSGINSVSPSPGGEITDPQGIAIDQSTGAVYVSAQDFRVQKFSATGAFEAAFGKDVVSGGATTTEVCTVASECKSGEFGEAGGEFTFTFEGFLAVAPVGSPNEGDLYVTDPANRRVQQFDSSGAFLATFGGDVELPAGGNAFEVCTVASDCKTGSEGSGEGEFFYGYPRGIVVDDAGRIYAVSHSGSNVTVQRFTSAPAFDTIYGATQISATNSSIKIAIDPGATAAGNASDDRVFVAWASGFSPEYVIKELGTAADPALVDTHMSGAGIASVDGLAVDASSDRLLVSSQTGGHRVYFLDNPLAAPVPVTNPVTTKTDTTASFTGTVDPQGGNVVCKFQYAIAADFSDATDVNVADCETLSISGGAQAVSANVTGLFPNTTYHVRLQISRPFVPGSTVTSASQSFATDPAPPIVSDVGAVQVEDTSARLVGTIDPRNAATSYVFEYGTTPVLGSSTAPLAIGGGTQPIVVSQVLTGLAKDTTYHFRLVATNPFGSTPSGQATLHTRAEPFAPAADRAYEQVSPVDKNFGNAVPGTATTLPPTEYVALDGQAVAFGSQNAFGDPPGQVLKNMATYISNRDESGWHTKPVFPNTCAADPTDTEIFWYALPVERAALLSANAERAVIPQREYAGCSTPPLDPAAPLPATNLYRVSLDDEPVGYDLLAPGFDEAPTKQSIISMTGEYIGASDDFSHVFYGTSKGTSGGRGEDLLQLGHRFTKLWEWDEGVLRLASVDPNGAPFTNGVAPVYASEVRQLKSDAVNSVSSDGSRFFFQGPVNHNINGPYDVYMRENGTATYKITESECTVSCADSEDPLDRKQRFRWASADGGLVTFTTPARLVNADEPFEFDGFVRTFDLYAYRHSPDPTAEPNLTVITEDNEPADGTVPKFREVIGMADDGSSVFFIADSQLVAGQTTADGPKVYRWSWNDGNPTLQYLASAMNDRQLPDEREEISEGGAESGKVPEHWERRVTRSGDVLMMEAKSRIDRVADHDDDVDVYLWRLGEGWTCISCQTPGTASGGPSTTGRTGPSKGGITGAERPVARELMSAIDEDGETVFFQTQDALVPNDTNGPCSFDTAVGYFPCTDIYEWHNGRLSLITTGTGSRDLGLIGVGESGEDVFFYSAEKLVGWDQDNLIDVYDARVGGGLPEPPEQPAACEGEACRGAGSAAPDASGAGTAVFQGPGNPTDNARKACPKGKRKVRRAGKTRCIKPRSTRKSKQRKRNRTANDNRRTAR